MELPPAAQRVSVAGRFDFYDLRAELREQGGGIGPGDQRAELDDLDARERHRLVGRVGARILVHRSILRRTVARMRTVDGC